MEDARRRLEGMGLSGVAVDGMSEVEWKLGEIKVGVDKSVDHAAVLLGTMRFGNTVNVNSGVSLEKTARAATIPDSSAKRSEEGRAGVSGGFGVGNGVHDGGDDNNVGSQFNNVSPAGMRGKLRQDPEQSSHVFLGGDPNEDSHTWPPLGTRNRQANQNCGGDDPSGGGTTQAPSPMFSQGPFSATSSNVSAMSAEREKAEKVFDSFNKSGRVSTPAFEALLTLLEVPVKRREGDATESAQAAGLLSANSFSRKDFIDWYLAWCLQKRTCDVYSPAGAATRVRTSAADGANDVRGRATFSAPQTLPKFDPRRRSTPAMNSPSSSDSEVYFSVKAAAAFRARQSATPANCTPGFTPTRAFVFGPASAPPAPAAPAAAHSSVSTPKPPPSPGVPTGGPAHKVAPAGPAGPLPQRSAWGIFDGTFAPKPTVKREASGFHVGMCGQSKAASKRSSRTSTKECATTASKSDLSTGFAFVPPACVAPQGAQSSTAFVFGSTDQRKQGVDTSAQAFMQQQRGSQRQGSEDSDAGDSCDSGLASPVPPTPRGSTGCESERVREEKERREKAAELLAHLRDKHDADAERARVTFMSSNFEVAIVQYTEAMASLEAVVNHIGRDSDIGKQERKRRAPLLHKRASACGMLGRYVYAIADCGLALLADIGYDRAYPILGKAYLLVGKLEQAEDVFRAGMRKDSDCEEDELQDEKCRLGLSNVHAVRAHLENAKKAVERDDKKSATEYADRALSDSPNLEAAQHLMLGVLMAEKKWEEACRMCEIWAYKRDMSIGRVHILEGFPEGGGSPLLCLQMMHDTIREGYIKSLRNAGRTDAFTAALDDATDMGFAWAKNMTRRRQEAMEKKDRADEAYASGLYLVAQKLYTEAIGVDEEDILTNALLYANRAAALMNLGKNKDALKDCEQALRLKPNYAEVLLRKARLLSRLGLWEESLKGYSSYLDVERIYQRWKEASAEADEVHAKFREERRRQQERRREEERRREKERRRKEADARSRSRRHDDWASRSGGRAGGGLYTTLGLEPFATTAQVKKAYRKLMIQHHPDKNLGDSAAALERSKELNAAYEVLRDESERRAYDDYLRSRLR